MGVLPELGQGASKHSPSAKAALAGPLAIRGGAGALSEAGPASAHRSPPGSPDGGAALARVSGVEQAVSLPQPGADHASTIVARLTGQHGPCQRFMERGNKPVPQTFELKDAAVEPRKQGGREGGLALMPYIGTECFAAEPGSGASALLQVGGGSQSG